MVRAPAPLPLRPGFQDLRGPAAAPHRDGDAVIQDHLGVPCPWTGATATPRRWRRAYTAQCGALRR
eukprot:8288985-Alexandrium_andersonii.AAC.1